MPTIKAAARRRFRSGDSREPRMEYNDIHCDDGRHLKEKSKKEEAVAVAVACHINVCFKRAGGAFPPKMSFVQGDSCPLCTLDRLFFVLPYNIQEQKQCNFRRRGVPRCGDRSLVRICKATRLMDRWTGEARWMELDETDADGAAHMQNLFKAKRTEICPHTHASFSTPEMSPAIFVFFRPPRSFTHRLAGAWLLALTLSMPIRLRET